MNNKKNYDIAKDELKKWLRISTDRTITSYIKEGIFPKPVRNSIDGELYFPKQEVLKILGITQVPDEPFITPKEACEILKIKPVSLASFVRTKGIPCYKIKNARGSHTLFLKSELEAVMQYKMKWETTLLNNIIKNRYAIMVLRQLFSSKHLLKGLKPSDRELMNKIFVEHQTVSQLLDETGMITDAGLKCRIIIACKQIMYRLKVLDKQVVFAESLIDENARLKAQLEILRKKYMPQADVQESNEMLDKLATSLMKYDLSVRAKNLLNAIGVERVNDLTKYSRADLNKYRNAGKKTIDELERTLKALGLSFKTENRIKVES